MNSAVKLVSLFFISILLIACNNDSSNRQESIVDVAVADGNFTTLVTALQATGLDATLADLDGTFTVFAPTDDAFAALGQDTIDALLADTDTLSDILLYHVIAGTEIDSAAAIASAGTTVEMANSDRIGISQSGDNLLVNLSTVTAVDVEADNGVIHVIDRVLIPPAEAGTPTDNIVETAINAGTFTTLVTALQASGLDSVLADESSTFTVFAPTDDAFAALPAGTIPALLADIPTLTDILLLHVVSGAAVDSVTAFSLNGNDVETAGGDTVQLSIVDGTLTVGGSTISTYDIYTTNGIIHVIDSVILQ